MYWLHRNLFYIIRSSFTLLHCCITLLYSLVKCISIHTEMHPSVLCLWMGIAAHCMETHWCVLCCAAKNGTCTIFVGFGALGIPIKWMGGTNTMHKAHSEPGVTLFWCVTLMFLQVLTCIVLMQSIEMTGLAAHQGVQKNLHHNTPQHMLPCTVVTAMHHSQRSDSPGSWALNPIYTKVTTVLYLQYRNSNVYIYMT